LNSQPQFWFASFAELVRRLSALKGATDVARAMIGLRDAQAMQTKVIELNSKILEAQSRAYAANDERAPPQIENIYSVSAL